MLKKTTTTKIALFLILHRWKCTFVVPRACTKQITLMLNVCMKLKLKVENRINLKQIERTDKSKTENENKAHNEN